MQLAWETASASRREIKAALLGLREVSKRLTSKCQIWHVAVAVTVGTLSPHWHLIVPLR